MEKHTVIGIDLAKRSNQVCRVNTRTGAVISNKSVKTAEFLHYMRNQPPARVAMEACGGAHHWARQLTALGHTVELYAPQFVKPFRRSHKTDANDALAVAECSMRPGIHCVALKSLLQQDVQTVIRSRELMLKQRTQLTNQLHGQLLEYGIAAPKGYKGLVETTLLAIEDAENELSMEIRALFDGHLEMLRIINAQLDTLTKQLTRYSKTIDACVRLLELEGVGPISSVELYCALGDGSAFKIGRQASAYLGLTPRQHSTGGKTTLVGIGRGSSPGLKATLIRGAHAVINSVKDKDDSKSQWLRSLLATKHRNVVAVALANKTVRTAWAMLRSGDDYDKNHVQQLPSAA